MGKYLIKRFLQSVLAVLGITLIVFLVLNLAGDPVELMLPPSATREEMEAMREEMGFNDPIMVQYGRFLSGAVRGDFGMSYTYKEPALDIVLERLPATLKLSCVAFLFSLLIGIPSGIISAVKRNKTVDNILRITALLGQCIPGFWLGIMLILLFAVKLHWLPSSGAETWKSIILPAFVLGFNLSATLTRLLRSNMLEVMGKEYVTVATSKGLRPFIVVMKHAFKNAFSSILTVLGMQFVNLIGNATIIETVFGWPGIGRLAIQSITASDFMVVEAVVFILAVSFVFVNFIVDVLYCVINPRIQLQ